MDLIQEASSSSVIEHTIHRALELHEAGLSVIPLSKENKKRPLGTGWQHKRSTKECIPLWFGSGHGIGILCGEASGGLEVIDFDEVGVIDEWLSTVEAMDQEAAKIARGLPIVLTASGRNHLFYRTHTCTGKEHLAYKDAVDVSGRRHKIRIEKLSDGQQVVASGAPEEVYQNGTQYKQISGKLLEDGVEYITDDVKNIFLTAARSLSLAPPTPSADFTYTGRSPNSTRDRLVGDDFNADPSVSIVSLLIDAGWTETFRSGEIAHMCHPASTNRREHNATVGHLRDSTGGPKLYVFSPNALPFEPARSYDKFGVYTILCHGGDFKAASKCLRQEKLYKKINPTRSTPDRDTDQTMDTDQPLGTTWTEVIIENRKGLYHEAITQGIEALSRHNNVYQRNGSLVRILEEKTTIAEDGTATKDLRIRRISPSMTGILLSEQAKWISYKSRGDIVEPYPDVPPEQVVAAIHSAGGWDHIRPLAGLTRIPVLTPSGEICGLDGPGYHAAIKHYCAPHVTLPTIKDAPTQVDAHQAGLALLDLIQDFPFKNDIDVDTGINIYKSSFLAAVLTPFSRFLYDGPTPLYMISSNKGGTGKGFLADILSIITTGSPMPTSSYTQGSDDETRKRITAAVMGSAPFICWDNISEGTIFGGSVLDQALTTTRWMDRPLYSSETEIFDLRIPMVATGNNIAIGTDIYRRLYATQLMTDREDPENRSRDEFSHPEILQHTRTHRGQLAAHAITILKGYLAAGKPRMGIDSWGTYERFSGIVREAVVWAGFPDPYKSREILKEADTTHDDLRDFVFGWKEVAGIAPMTSSEMLMKLKQGEDRGETWRIFDSLGPVSKMGPRGFGMIIKKYRDKTVSDGDGRRVVLETHSEDTDKTRRYVVVESESVQEKLPF